MAFISIPAAKAQATLLQKRLNELGVSIKRTQAIEAVAAIHNFEDWNRFKAHVDGNPAIASRTCMKECKILVAPPGYGKSTTMETIFTLQAKTGNDTPVYIEMVDEPYRPIFLSHANKYLGGTDTQPCIQLIACNEDLRFDILESAKALYLQVPVKNNGEGGAQDLARAMRRVAEAFRRCEERTPGTIFIDELHKVYDTSADLKDAFEHAFEGCKINPERFVIATQVWSHWLTKTIKGALKVIYKKTGLHDDDFLEMNRHRELLSDNVFYIQELFQDDERMIEDMFQWISLGVKNSIRCPFPDTPITQALELNRWLVEGEIPLKTWRFS